MATDPQAAPLSVVADGTQTSGTDVEWNPSPQFRRMVAERDRLRAALSDSQAEATGLERDRIAAVAEAGRLRAALERLTEAAERLRAYGTQANRATLLAEASRARAVLGGAPGAS